MKKTSDVVSVLVLCPKPLHEVCEMRIVPEHQQLVQVGAEFGGSKVIGVPFYVRRDRRKAEQFVVYECSCGSVNCCSVPVLRRRKHCTCCWISVSAKMTGNSNSRRIGTDRNWSKTRLYSIHEKMRARCLDPKHKKYDCYGGRGISICQDWMDFVKFKDWAMSSGYEDHLTLDRENNDGNYEPGNCRWITQAKQLLNKRTNRRMEAFGETKTVKEWFLDPRCVVKENTLRGRLFDGFTLEIAMTTPAGMKSGPRKNKGRCDGTVEN